MMTEKQKIGNAKRRLSCEAKRLAKLASSVKQCTKCKQSKPNEAFRARHRYQKGVLLYSDLHSACSECLAANLRKNYAINRETYLAYARQPNVRAKCRATYKERTSNPEYRAWLNKAGVIFAGRRRVRKASIEGSHTLDEWQELVDSYEHRCLRCGRHESEAGKMTQDHIVPIGPDCTDYIDNIQPLCGSCNSAKRDRQAIDYRSEFFYVIDMSPTPSHLANEAPNAVNLATNVATS